MSPLCLMDLYCSEPQLTNSKVPVLNLFRKLRSCHIKFRNRAFRYFSSSKEVSNCSFSCIKL